jgi:hypothetical protein
MGGHMLWNKSVVWIVFGVFYRHPINLVLFYFVHVTQLHQSYSNRLFNINKWKMDSNFVTLKMNKTNAGLQNRLS